jgi:hypothetical protein
MIRRSRRQLLRESLVLAGLSLLSGCEPQRLPWQGQQPTKADRIGWLSVAAPGPTTSPLVEALRQGLREHGWVEGQNLAIIEQPTTFEFVMNLTTGQALGLTIPPSVLQQATELIQ